MTLPRLQTQLQLRQLSLRTHLPQLPNPANVYAIAATVVVPNLILIVLQGNQQSEPTLLTRTPFPKQKTWLKKIRICCGTSARAWTVQVLQTIWESKGHTGRRTTLYTYRGEGKEHPALFLTK